MCKAGAAFFEQFIPRRIAGRRNILEEAELGKNAGCRTDCRNLFSLFAEGDDLVHELTAGAQIGCSRYAAGKDEHIVLIKVKLRDGSVCAECDFVGGCDFRDSVDRYFCAGDPRPVQKIHDSEAFDLFTAVSKENGGLQICFCFKHIYSFFGLQDNRCDSCREAPGACLRCRFSLSIVTHPIQNV